MSLEACLTSCYTHDMISDREAHSHISNTTNITEDTLWVDRYRPQRFTDLVGNEKVARDAMVWLKEWDFCVFGKSKGKKRIRDGDENVNTDEFRRPQEKVHPASLTCHLPSVNMTSDSSVIRPSGSWENDISSCGCPSSWIRSNGNQRKVR